MPRPLLLLSFLLLPPLLALGAETAPPDPAAAAVARLRSPEAAYADWEAILAIGKPAVPALQKLLSDPSEPVQAHAAVLLYRLGEAPALDKLAALVESKDDDARREAADALQAFVGAPIGPSLSGSAGASPSQAPEADRAKALEVWRAWWKSNRDEALKLAPMSTLSARVVSVNPATRLVALSLSVRHGARRGMQFNVVRGGQPVCLVDIVVPADDCSVARIVDLSERGQVRAGDRAFWNAR